MRIQVVKRFTREKNLILKLLTKSEGDTDKLGRFEVVKFFFTVSAADLIKALRELESGEGDIEQTITIVDVTAPVLVGTPDAEITVECDQVPAAAVVTGFYFQRKFQTTSSKKAELNLSAANA